MAKASAANKGKNQQNRPALPEGFEDVGRAKLDGWFIREAGNEVQGFLRGFFNMKGKFGQRRVYRIELSGDNNETRVLDSDGDNQTLSEGTIGIDETGYLKVLAEDKFKDREVFIRCIGKTGKKKEDPWDFQIGAVPF